MSTFTPLLNLIKPEGGDVVNVVNFNTNSDILDNAVLLAATQTLTNKTLTAPSITAGAFTGGLTVGGGATITNGGLRVTLGNVGIGAVPVTSTALLISSVTLAGPSQIGINVNPTTSNAADNVTGMSVGVSTIAGGYSLSDAYSLYVRRPSLGAGSGIVNSYGVYVEAMSNASLLNYGLYVETPSGGATANIGLFVQGGGVLLAGTVPTTAANQLAFGGTTTTSATAGANGATPAQVAGYLVSHQGGSAIRIPFYNA
jgi:hypothetical protein